jgi:hypothetical protein
MATEKPNTVPKKGSDAEAYKAFFDQFGNIDSPARQELLAQCAENKALVESHQWLAAQPKTGLGRVPRFFDQAANDIPMPDKNRILELVDNETAKLGRRKSKGKVRSKVQREGEQGAARAGSEILEHHLKEMRWDRVRRRAIYRNVVYGTLLIRSHWDTDYLETVRVGVDKGHKCADCGTMYADKGDVSVKQMMGLGPKARMLTRSDDYDFTNPALKTKYSLETCLECGSGPLLPYVPTPEEHDGVDPLGRPLGLDVPKGNAVLESLEPWEVHVENEGIGIDPETCSEWMVEQIKSLDWVKGHFKHPEIEDLLAEDQAMLIDRHPVLGETEGGGSSASRNLFRNHVRVRWYYKKPVDAKDLGRYVIMAGRLLIHDGDLCVWTKDEKGRKNKLQRCKLLVGRFWIKDGELFGMPLIQPLKSPQRRINMIGSQVIDRRERHVEVMASTQGMKVRPGANVAGLTGSNLVFDPDPEFPDGPKFVETKLIDQGVYKEEESLEQFMREVVGAYDGDLGKTPPSGTPAIQYKLMADQASGRREERENELKNTFEEAYSHQMQLLQHFAREDRRYDVMGPGEQWEEKSYKGADLVGQTDIEIEEEASYDEDAYTKEMVIQADGMGLIPKDDPITLHEVLKVMGLPSSIAERRNVQIEDASRKWAGFKDRNKVPVPDPSQDDHGLKFAFYGKVLMGEDGVAIKERARWDEILPLIAGWDDQPGQPNLDGTPGKPPGALARAEALDLQVRQIQATLSAPPPKPIDPATAQDPFQAAQIEGANQAAMAPYQQAQEMLLTLPADPAQLLLPKALEQRIFVVWQQMLQEAEYQVAPEQLPLLQFEAVVEAHRLYDERKTKELAMGMAPSMAPGEALPGQPQVAA